jgi:hypothetical protein
MPDTATRRPRGRLRTSQLRRVLSLSQQDNSRALTGMLTHSCISQFQHQLHGCFSAQKFCAACGLKAGPHHGRLDAEALSSSTLPLYAWHACKFKVAADIS